MPGVHGGLLCGGYYSLGLSEVSQGSDLGSRHFLEDGVSFPITSLCFHMPGRIIDNALGPDAFSGIRS